MMKEPTEEERQKIQEKFRAMSEELSNLVDSALSMYNKAHCPCSYPRFIQITSIDCSDYRNSSFECYDTEALIGKSRSCFETIEIEQPHEAYAERWICKKCQSEFRLSWQDFSISVDRHTLTPINLRALTVGKSCKIPIPLYMGLAGHAFPSKRKIKTVGLEEFKNYILEK